MQQRGICVIIPTYNNGKTVVDVIERTLKQCADVIVVNDGSTDNTPTLLHHTAGITIIDRERNEGKGAALKHGFRKAVEMGFAYAITLDADGQHFPEDIPLLIEANVKHPHCIIMGQRILEGVDRSGGSKFANAFSNFWFCVQTFHYLADTQTGFRLYPLHRLKGLSLLTSRYEAELELLVFSSWHGVDIIPVDVKVYYPPRNERVSHFRPIPDFTRITILNTFLCMLAVVYGLPCAIYRVLYIALFTIVSLIVYLVGALLVITPYTAAVKCLKKGTLPVHKILHISARFATAVLQIFCSKVIIRNKHCEDFTKPAVIICNHQSHLDLILQMGLTSKIVFLTNDWVWKSPFFGYVIRNAEYLPASEGIDQLLPKIKSLVERGYCISIFPEGTRSTDCSIGRFHKGAFHIAKELGIDVLPLVLYGAGKVLPKNGVYMRRQTICLDIDRRVPYIHREEAGMLTIREESNRFRKYYRQRYAELCNEMEKI